MEGCSEAEVNTSWHVVACCFPLRGAEGHEGHEGIGELACLRGFLCWAWVQEGLGGQVRAPSLLHFAWVLGL